MIFDKLKHELMCQLNVNNALKDIVIIVHNQLDYTRQCIESIKKHTLNYNLFIWDNGSDQDTQDYLKTLNATIIRSEENIGFIKPNNILVSKGNAPYIILLNNDTIVQQGWDKALLGFLQNNIEYGLVGYLGGLLDQNGKGCEVKRGSDIDFVHGWCMCFERNLYNKIGLFDEVNLQMAFCEDADFSFRVKEAGLKIYALYIDLIYHYGNITIKEISKKNNTLDYFHKNHEYVKSRWHQYFKINLK